MPDLADALRSALAQRQAGRLPEAIAAYEAVLRTHPAEPAAELGLADTLHHAGELERAADAYGRALALDPGVPAAWWGLGCTRTAQKDYAAAAEAYRRLLALEPGHGMARANLARSLYELGEVAAAIDGFRAARRLLPPEAVSLPLLNVAMIAPGSPRATNADVLAARRDFAHLLPPAAPRPRARRVPGRAPRVGYVCGFFERRNWMKPVWAVLRHHDRARVAVHVFADGPAPGPELGFALDRRDEFYDVNALSTEALARRVRELGIDVLVDLNGYSRPLRLPLFLLRPAPVQVTWFNMFGTSGLDGAFDALIGDEHVIPPDEERWYSERILRVPGSYLTFEVTYPVPDVVPPPCAAGRPLAFGCLAPQYKLTPETIAAWSRVLAASPGTRLILKNVQLGTASGRGYVHAAFAHHGIGPERLLLEGPDDHFRFLAAYERIDVALDTFPYNGGTTTMEALWQGVPVLAFAGDRWAARISASLLREARLGDWVAGDVADLEARAIALAADPATPSRLQALRTSMRDRLRTAPVCDAAALARSLEDIYLELLREA